MAEQSAHSYIAIESTDYCCLGALAEVVEGDLFQSHNHEADRLGLDHLPRSGPYDISPHKMAPLTEKECVLLNGIWDGVSTYIAYSTPGKLAWGLGLKVGDEVLARLPDDTADRHALSTDPLYAAAIIRWAGPMIGFGYQFGVEIMDEKCYGRGNTDGEYKWRGLTSVRQKRLFVCPPNRGLFLTFAELEPPPPPLNRALSTELPSQLERELREQIQHLSSSEERLRSEKSRLCKKMRKKNSTVSRLQGRVRRRDSTVTRLEQEVRERDSTVTTLQREARKRNRIVARLRGELREKDNQRAMLEASFHDQLVNEREHHVTELHEVRQEAEQYQRQLREEQVQRQQLVTRIDTAMANLRGEAVSPQALELWELPREEVHISQTVLGTGGWGYVASGTFRGQAVAVKCLHRGILSPQNEGRLRREISIMFQVRHPNLLLLIGAVLTVEGAGPLIVTELLDRSLRSAYEEGMLEERSKVPVLRDVSSALTYLHSHRTPIIHRDVSSANVLLEAIRDGQWKAKLSDFGSANLSHLASTPAEGAAVYAAPEVSTEDRNRQTAKIDVYSFGVLVCEVCLCRFPPERREFPSMLSEVHGRAPHMFHLSRDCTSHAPHDRPTMREVLQRIDQLTQD